MPLAPTAPLADLPDDTLAALRARFTDAGFDDAVLAAAEAVAPGQLDVIRVPLVRYALAKRDDVAALLARLFVYGDTVPDEAARAALGDGPHGALLAAGVVAREGRGVRAAFRITPYEGLWFLADEPSSGDEAVMGPGPTTAHIANMMPGVVKGAALDVGCGAGTLALHAAKRGASRAVGVDLSERAVDVARFNARLNGIAAEFRAGDLLAPVAGERFDLVVAQPPYVIRPPDTRNVTFLHGGPMGDDITMRLLADLPAALADGGLAVVLFDTVVRPREPLHARVRARLAGAPVDLLVLAAPGVAPDLQAVAYAWLEDPELGPRYVAAVQRYRAHLDAIGATEFSHAVVALRRTPGAPAGGRYTITLPVRPHAFAQAQGDTLESLLAAIDLAAADDASLLRGAVRCPPGARFVEERERPDLGLEPARTLRFGRGAIANDRELSEAVFVLYGALDASESVARAVEVYADACGTTPDQVRRQVLQFVREQLARGTLVPAGRTA